MVYDEYMPKKTLALIAGLVLVTVILAIIAYRTGQQVQKYPKQEPQKQQEAVDMAHTTLAMSPNPVEVASGQPGAVEIVVDTSDNPVTAVQFELMYDPTMLTNVKITPGPLFANAAVLLNKNTPTTGKYVYAVGIQPSQKPISGTGSVATITFTARGTVGKQSQLSFVPAESKTLVSARGIAKSVLKSSVGTTVMIGAGSAATGQDQGATIQTVPVTTAPTQ